MKEFCKVINKSAGRVVYNVREMGVHRVFFPKETKEISVKELSALVQTPGGKNLVYNYLLVDDPEVISYLINGKVEPEYWIKEADIPNWMATCSLDEFKDALDFAPEGTKDLIKTYAVSIPLNDYSKREAIKEQLGFDVTRAIENSGDEEQNSASAVAKPTGRRVPVAEETSKRRVVTVSE